MESCPICHNRSKDIFTVDDFPIQECLSCTHRFVQLQSTPDHLQKNYNDSYFFGGGAGYSNYLEEKSLRIESGKKYADILARFTNPGKLLDVGAAAGFILEGLMEKGWNGTGLEPNASMANYGKEKLGKNIINGSLEKHTTEVPYDVISMIQVLPHFYDLREALGRASDLTSPSGYWLIETWNKDSLVARLFGKNWHEYSPPSVLHFFSPTSLDLLASQYGFVRIARGRPCKKIIGSHARSLLTYKLENMPGGKFLTRCARIIPEKMVIPYPSFDLFWSLYQKKEAALPETTTKFDEQDQLTTRSH